MIFELDNVELYFKNKPILNGIYLKVETGKVTALLGRNGCGKSSVMEIAFGNLKPKYKLIRINNKAYLKPLYTSGLVKYLPQYHFISGGMTLDAVFKLFKLDWTAFTHMFEAFAKYHKTKFKGLSGGERRLIEIYCILKSKSELVFLDEPFSHLAPLYIEAIQQLILEEKVKKAILISDHMYEHIMASADRVYLLKNGCTKRINDGSELKTYHHLT